MSLHNLHDKLERALLKTSGKALLTPEGFLLGWGKTIPTASATTDNYAPGAHFFHTDGAAGSQWYVNEGTAILNSFVAIANATQQAILAAITATAVEINKLAGVTAGTTTASKALVVDATKALDTLSLSAGAAAAAVALRLGATATEGTEIKVINELVTLTNAVETNLTNTVPSGAVILSVQGNLQTTVVGDASGDDGLVKVGIGTTADPDKYGKSADLVKNTKIDTIPDWAVLSGAETVCVKAADTSGAAVTEKFVAGGIVRVRIVYLALNSLDNAA